MDRWGCWAEHGRQCGDVVRLAGGDVVAETDCDDHEVGVDDV